MADAQIATIVIPCLVVQYNNQQFLENQTIIGQTLDVPCRNVHIGEVPYWATPVKDYGVFSGWTYKLIRQNGGIQIPAPTFDSFLVTQIRDKISKDTWWIYGTKDQFLNSCATCCGSAVVPMPGIDGQFQPMIAPCQEFCNVPNNDGVLRAIFGIPNPLGPDTFYPYGSYNNVAFATASAAGYATVTLLLAYLNATWNTGGGHALTWSASPDGLTLYVQGGALGDSICVVINRIGPSS